MMWNKDPELTSACMQTESTARICCIILSNCSCVLPILAIQLLQAFEQARSRWIQQGGDVDDITAVPCHTRPCGACQMPQVAAKIVPGRGPDVEGCPFVIADLLAVGEAGWDSIAPAEYTSFTLCLKALLMIIPAWVSQNLLTRWTFLESVMDA